jgi:hypothetical protein
MASSLARDGLEEEPTEKEDVIIITQGLNIDYLRSILAIVALLLLDNSRWYDRQLGLKQPDMDWSRA